jgi:hypothetical protein
MTPPVVVKTGYQGFGSFHAGDPEHLIRVAAEAYEAPALPFATDDLFEGLEGAEMGAPMRRHFMIDFERWTFINHGAFGSPVRPAQREADCWRLRCEAQPLAFLDR